MLTINGHKCHRLVACYRDGVFFGAEFKFGSHLGWEYFYLLKIITIMIDFKSVWSYINPASWSSG